MAQAARKIWLEPEEQPEVPVVRPATPPRKLSFALWTRIAGATLAVAVGVGLVLAFVSTYATIARYEYQRQSLTQQYAQLNQECIDLHLELERLAAQPRLMKVAQADQLELPDPSRVHYVRVAQAIPQSLTAASAPPPASWMARVQRQFVAEINTAWRLLGRGPIDPAYAQD